MVGFLCFDGVCLFSGAVCEGAKREGGATPAKCPLHTLLDELFSGGWLASFVIYVRERMCVDGVQVRSGDVRVVFVEVGLYSWRVLS